MDCLSLYRLMLVKTSAISYRLFYLQHNLMVGSRSVILI